MREDKYSKTIEPVLNGQIIDLILYLRSVGVLNKVNCYQCRTQLKIVQYAKSVDLYCFRCMTCACKSNKKAFHYVQIQSLRFNFSLVVCFELCWKLLGDATQK
jgi:hypothetical protein